MNSRKAYHRNPSADSGAVESLALQKPIILRFDAVILQRWETAVSETR